MKAHYKAQTQACLRLHPKPRLVKEMNWAPLVHRWQHWYQIMPTRFTFVDDEHCFHLSTNNLFYMWDKCCHLTVSDEA